MGSEQSTQHSPGPLSGRARNAGQFRRGKSIPEREMGMDEAGRPGSISPGPSICSDSDLPYISYTVNRPIGDSPKLPHKHSAQLQRGKSLGGNPTSRKASTNILKRQMLTLTKSSAHSIVVVKPAINAEATDKDPDLLRLQNVPAFVPILQDLMCTALEQWVFYHSKSVPMFLPIMRGTLNLPAVRDPEVLERLDPNGLLGLCLRYEEQLAACSELVASEQAQLGHKVRDVDFDISRLMAVMMERQKKYAKYAEKMSNVHELRHQLNRCHMVLNQTLESMETLNNALPVEERLEPFVWTTG